MNFFDILIQISSPVLLFLLPYAYTTENLTIILLYTRFKNQYFNLVAMRILKVSKFIPQQHPIETYGYGFLLSVTGYLGIQVVLTLVRTTGATTAVTVTTTRKAMSIVVSFIFFAKPFTMQYVWSGLVIVLGIYLNVYSKRSKLSFTELMQKLMRLLPSSSDKSSRQRLLDV